MSVLTLLIGVITILVLLLSPDGGLLAGTLQLVFVLATAASAILDARRE